MYIAWIAFIGSETMYNYPWEVDMANVLRQIAALMLFSVFLPMGALNHLDIMHIIDGEYNDSKIGSDLAAPDFNGDGIQDLVVVQPGWAGPDPQSNPPYGRILFYWGGVDFDIVPDFILEGEPDNRIIASNMICPGDMNNDGYDDLCFVRGIGFYPDRMYRFCVYFGGANPSSTPGFSIDLPRYSDDNVCGIEGMFIRWVGDVNGDNYADVGLVADWSYPSHRKVDIICGGSFTFYTVYDTYTETNTAPAIGGVGDVNNDGYDDFILGFTNNNQFNCNNLVLYYGNPDLSSSVTVTLATDSSLDYQMKPGAVGDVNNDGYADFLGRLLWDGSEDWGALWFGGNEITPQYDVEMRPAYFGPLLSDWGLAYGDLNGDGYDDVIGSDYISQHDSGRIAVWLGGLNFNGVTDLVKYYPQGSPNMSFGYSMATGDFNNDGLCDLAVGAPMRPVDMNPVPGRVFIFSGNAELLDTTVANDDELTPSLGDNWALSLYPNPLSRQNNVLNIEFIGNGYRKAHQISLDIYNIKGQKLHSLNVNNPEAAYLMPNETTSGLGSGLYFIRVNSDDKPVFTKKLCIVR